MSEWVEYMTFDGESPMSNLRKANGREKPWKLKYFGVGNENWGCGGNMRAEYYADVYRRYQTYVRNYGENRIYRIACGPNVADYHWMEVLMREARRFMNGISLHYYTVPGEWSKKGSATQFNEQEWFTTLQKALYMETLVKNHIAIMDRYDPAKRIGLIVDEWGTWYDVEPGTNPGFLYQQNSLRDALVAGIHLNIFNQYNDRIHMANIAQTVNVLQSMILTEGEKMIVTPTYHVFDMYKVHHDATRVDLYIQSEDYVMGDQKLPKLSGSASKDAEGRINITLCNLDHENGADVPIDLRGMGEAKKVTGTVLTADRMQAHNTFDQPDNVKPVSFEEFSVNGSVLNVKMPSKSVVLLTIEA